MLGYCASKVVSSEPNAYVRVPAAPTANGFPLEAKLTKELVSEV